MSEEELLRQILMKQEITNRFLYQLIELQKELIKKCEYDL